MKTIACLMFAFFAFNGARGGEDLIVHEWGTFTSLQDESGRTIGGINSDDEPVPPFVHDLNRFLLLENAQLPPVLFQGAPSCHPGVTMRLETPVIYFYPAKTTVANGSARSADVARPTGSMTVDVTVAFKGGWLTQYYPNAQAQAPGVGPGPAFGPLTDKITGKLSWTGLRIGGEAAGPKTSERVWTAPRQVNSAGVTTREGESEKFLFYRGVGHLPAPLRVSRQDETLELRSQTPANLTGRLNVARLWFCEFDAHQGCAFREIGPVNLARGSAEVLARVPATFAMADFDSANLARLRAQMHRALVADGLFPDEAEALLATWELSYFKSAGQRLFFLVPRSWTDYVLPLDISAPAAIVRVMVGRIELVTPQHRRLLRQLAGAPVPDKPWASVEVINGRAAFKGIMPEVYRDLGRFRNALILDEAQRRPSRSLEAFISVNGLGAFAVRQ